MLIFHLVQFQGFGIRTPAVTPTDTDEPFVVPLNVPSRFITQYDASAVCAEVIHLSRVSPVRCSSIYTHFLFLPCSDSWRDRAAANKKKKISRDTAGLEEDIFSVSFLLLEMVMRQLLKLNQAEMP